MFEFKNGTRSGKACNRKQVENASDLEDRKRKNLKN